MPSGTAKAQVCPRPTPFYFPSVCLSSAATVHPCELTRQYCLMELLIARLSDHVRDCHFQNGCNRPWLILCDTCARVLEWQVHIVFLRVSMDPRRQLSQSSRRWIAVSKLTFAEDRDNSVSSWATQIYKNGHVNGKLNPLRRFRE